MAPLLDERSRRRWAASEARMIGHGGVSAVAEATGRDVSIGAIYATLDRLERKGYLKSWQGEATPELSRHPIDVGADGRIVGLF